MTTRGRLFNNILTVEKFSCRLASFERRECRKKRVQTHTSRAYTGRAEKKMARSPSPKRKRTSSHEKAKTHATRAEADNEPRKNDNVWSQVRDGETRANLFGVVAWTSFYLLTLSLTATLNDEIRVSLLLAGAAALIRPMGTFSLVGIMTAFCAGDLLSIAGGLVPGLHSRDVDPVLGTEDFWLRAWSASCGLLLTGQLALLMTGTRKPGFFFAFWAGSVLAVSLPQIEITWQRGGSSLSAARAALSTAIATAVLLALLSSRRRHGRGERLRATSAGADVALLVYHTVALGALVARKLSISGVHWPVDWARDVEPSMSQHSATLEVEAMMDAALGTVGVFHALALCEIAYRIGTGRRGVLGNWGVELGRFVVESAND